MALPTAGMCELVTPPMILAIPVPRPLREPCGQALAFREQLRLELARRDALELRARILHRRAARDRHLRQVVDVRAGAEHAEEVFLQHEILIWACDTISIAVHRRIAVELGAIA